MQSPALEPPRPHAAYTPAPTAPQAWCQRPLFRFVDSTLCWPSRCSSCPCRSHVSNNRQSTSGLTVNNPGMPAANPFASKNYFMPATSRNPFCHTFLRQLLALGLNARIVSYADGAMGFLLRFAIRVAPSTFENSISCLYLTWFEKNKQHMRRSLPMFVKSGRPFLPVWHSKDMSVV